MDSALQSFTYLVSYIVPVHIIFTRKCLRGAREVSAVRDVRENASGTHQDANCPILFAHAAWNYFYIIFLVLPEFQFPRFFPGFPDSQFS